MLESILLQLAPIHNVAIKKTSITSMHTPKFLKLESYMDWF